MRSRLSLLIAMPVLCILWIIGFALYCLSEPSAEGNKTRDTTVWLIDAEKVEARWLVPKSA